MLLDPERELSEIWIGALDGSPQPLKNLARNIALKGIKVIEDGIYRDELASIIPDLDPIRTQLQYSAIKQAVTRGFN